MDNDTAYFAGTITYTRKMFMESTPSGMYYKRLWVRNLREMEKFCSKLLSSGLDIHAISKNTLV